MVPAADLPTTGARSSPWTPGCWEVGGPDDAPDVEAAPPMRAPRLTSAAAAAAIVREMTRGVAVDMGVPSDEGGPGRGPPGRASDRAPRWNVGPTGTRRLRPTSCTAGTGTSDSKELTG